MESSRYKSPDEIHEQLLKPAGVGGVLAVIATGPAESRVACRSWSEAYRLLTYCTADVQRKLGLRCKPATIEGVPLTRTQMARLAQSEGPPHPHVLRAESPRASLTSPGVKFHDVHPQRGGASRNSTRASGVPPE